MSNADFASMIFKRYIRAVLTRMQHYTDELLFSCLQLVLNVPRAFADIKVLIGPLKLAFKVRLVFSHYCRTHTSCSMYILFTRVLYQHWC